MYNKVGNSIVDIKVIGFTMHHEKKIKHDETGTCRPCFNPAELGEIQPSVGLDGHNWPTHRLPLPFISLSPSLSFSIPSL